MAIPNSWGQQIDLLSSFAEHILATDGGPLFDAIDSLSASDAKDLIWILRTRIKIERGDYNTGGD